MPRGRLRGDRRGARLRIRRRARELQLHRQPRQLEAADGSLPVEHREQQSDRRHRQQRGRDRASARWPLPHLDPLPRPQALGHAHHAACGRGHGPDRPDGAERTAPAAPREDPRVRLQRQRVDERRAGHGGGGPQRLPGRARGADRKRGHRRLQQRAPLWRRLHHAATRGRPPRRRLCADQQPRACDLLHRRTSARRAVQRRPEQPVVPDDHDRRRPEPPGGRRGGKRRHGCAGRAALGAADRAHRLLVRFRLRSAGLREPGHGRDHGAGEELARMAAVRRS